MDPCSHTAAWMHGCLFYKQGSNQAPWEGWRDCRARDLSIKPCRNAEGGEGCLRWTHQLRHDSSGFSAWGWNHPQISVSLPLPSSCLSWRHHKLKPAFYNSNCLSSAFQGFGRDPKNKHPKLRRKFSIKCKRNPNMLKNGNQNNSSFALQWPRAIRIHLWLDNSGGWSPK